jgi:peptidoglycan hydrolase-like protein with peptidoglycan-binding domain
VTEVRLGQSGEAVTRLQHALYSAGYYIGTENGLYGPHTEAAVRYLQSCHGLTIDGVAGAQTLTVLGLPVKSVPQIDVKLAVVDLMPGKALVVRVRSLGAVGRRVRVVGWFRSPGADGHSEVTVDAPLGVVREARLPIPPSIASSAGDRQVTVYVFDADQGTQLEETFASFPSIRAANDGAWPN